MEPPTNPGRFTAPKVAMLYRHAADDVVASISRRIEGTEHGVEILGAGKLLTVHGRHHKTGHYFKWLDGMNSPLVLGPDAAPLVSSAKVEEFMAAVDARFKFAKTFSASMADAWNGSGDTRGVRLPNVGEKCGVQRNGEGRIIDGRKHYLRSVVFQAAIVGNAEAYHAAVARGPEGIQEYKDNITAAVVDHARDAFAFTGEWRESALPRLVSGMVNSQVAKALAGKVTVSARSPVGRQTEAAETLEAYNTRRSNLPVVRILPGDLKALVTAAEDALIASGKPFFQRSGKIVKVARVKVRTARSGEVDGMRIAMLGDRRILEEIEDSARFERYDARTKAFKATDVGIDVAKTLMQRESDLRLPVIEGFVNAPLMRMDGSILDKPGYDEETGLVYDPCGQVFPAIPAKPTREQALEALGVFDQVLGTFPFVSPLDRSVALSGLFTAVVRKSLNGAPMHAFSAKSPGSGKSKLTDMASVVATGREAGVMSPANSEEELEKRLGGLLMAGEPVISIDNVMPFVPLKGAFLFSVLTSPTVSARPLGASDIVVITTRSLLMCNGNNLTIQEDLVRRTLICHLDAGVENPETREFDFEPVARTKEMRTKLVVAALTIMRAYQVAGRPRVGGIPLGNFEQWCSMVRNPLVWLGEADPVTSVNVAREQDPVLEMQRAALMQWSEVLGNRAVSCRQIIEACSEVAGGRTYGPIKNADFLEALLAVTRQKEQLTSATLGRWIGGIEGRVIGGRKLVKSGTVRGFQTYRLEEVDLLTQA